MPVGEFYRHPQMGDGHLNHCKDCKRAYAADRHHQKMLDPAWLERERARGRAKTIANRERAPTKRKANTAVSNAIRDKRLIPGTRCEDCGHDFRHHRREAHHEDYDKPLQVEWLCSLCHGKRHRWRDK